MWRCMQEQSEESGSQIHPSRGAPFALAAGLGVSHHRAQLRVRRSVRRTDLLVPAPPGVVTAFNVAEYSIWAVFIVDYAVQLSLASDKRYFLRHEWLTLLFVVFPFQPVRAVRGVLFIRQANTKKKSLVRSLPAILGSMAVLLVVIAGAAVLNAERCHHHDTVRRPLVGDHSGHDLGEREPDPGHQ